MTLVLAIQHQRPYLEGRKILVYTDQKSPNTCWIRGLRLRVNKIGQQNCWDMNLKSSTKLVQRIKQLTLSRKENDKEIQALSKPYWQDISEIDQEVFADLVLGKIEDLKVDLDSHGKYTLENARLYFIGMLVLPTNSSWIPQLFKEFHSSLVGGHSGVYRTYRSLSQSLYWKGMLKTIIDLVAAWHICLRSKYLTSSLVGLLQPLSIPNVV